MYLKESKAPGLDYCNPSHFAELSVCAETALGNTDVYPDDEQKLTIASCWLGPHGKGIPPPEMRAELLAIARNLEPDSMCRPLRAMEFAVAYGCGKWRNPISGQGDWNQRWSGGIGALARTVVTAIKKAVYQEGRLVFSGVDPWLWRHMLGYPRDKSMHQIGLEATRIAEMLLDPEREVRLESGQTMELRLVEDGVQVAFCGSFWIPRTVRPGAKYVFRTITPVRLRTPNQTCTISAGKQIVVLARDDGAWITSPGIRRISLTRRSADTMYLSTVGPVSLTEIQCSCASGHCCAQHRLDGWDPRVSLWSFVASAVKGPRSVMKPNSVTQGMYVPWLMHRGVPRIRPAEVEVDVCVCGTEYQGPENSLRPGCDHRLGSAHTRRISRNYLIVDDDNTAVYERVRRQRCRNRVVHYSHVHENGRPVPDGIGNSEFWDNLYEFADTKSEAVCPICGERPAKSRETAVWVLKEEFYHEARQVNMNDWAEEIEDDDSYRAERRQLTVRRRGKGRKEGHENE